MCCQGHQHSFGDLNLFQILILTGVEMTLGCLVCPLCSKDSVQDVQFRLGSLNVGQLKVTKCEDFLPPQPQSWSVVRDKRVLLVFGPTATTG